MFSYLTFDISFTITFYIYSSRDYACFVKKGSLVTQNKILEIVCLKSDRVCAQHSIRDRILPKTTGVAFYLISIKLV